MDIKFFSILIFCFSLTLVGLYFLIPFLLKNQFVDIPNSRSSHTKHTPRGGGLAIIIGILVGSSLAYFNGYPIPPFSFYFEILIVFVTSIFDDRKSLSVLTRLALHSLAAFLVIHYTGGLKYIPLPFADSLKLGFWSIPLTYIWILAVLNIYNFLDGIDGFSATQAIIAGLGIAILDWGSIGMVVGLLVAVTSTAFLIYNWHPAKVFMGDAGSITLGFLFAAMPFYLKNIPSEKGVFLIAIFLWFFISDGVFTIVRRLLNREKVWEAHRSHLFQRLIKSGLRHNQVTILVMVPGAILAGLQVYFYPNFHQFRIQLFATAIIFFCLYVLFVFLRERRKKI